MIQLPDDVDEISLEVLDRMQIQSGNLPVV
jgi:hypothetical protein